jgi:stage V sporulation protein R
MNDRDLPRMAEALEKIWEVGQSLGLDPYPIHFEVVPASIMYEVGAYGIPGRFSHWTHGKAYHQLKMMYDYGLSRIYELVINTDPSYAFLAEGNSLTQNRMVAAHVLAHVDFFKHNAYFEQTNRRMVDLASVNADRIRKYEFQHGRVEVESFLDAVLSIQEHVDPNVHIRRQSAEELEEKHREREAKAKRHYQEPTPYDDLFELDPVPASSGGQREPPAKFPEEPERDLLLFIAENAEGLQDWQRDVIRIVRTEMLYFLPQMQTKILNEGWATYWHLRIMRELDLTEDEYIEFAELHANVAMPSRRQLNPYFVGLKLLEDIERRWDNPTEEEQRRYGRRPGQGRQKLFEVREMESDASFIRNYLTRDLVNDLDLYIYRQEGDQLVVVEKDWERIRNALTRSLASMGIPYITVDDADYHHARELYLKHLYEGEELDIAYAERTLRHVFILWGRPVHLETVVDGNRVVLSYDGEKNERAVVK